MKQSPAPARRRFPDINGWAFVGSALLLMAIFTVYPIARSLWMSTHAGQGTMVKFVGLGNVERLVSDPMFLRALSNTFIYLIVQVPVMIVLALVLASCLNMPGLRCRGLLRTAVFLPCVTSLVAYSMLFKSMFSYDGVVNATLLKLGLVDGPLVAGGDDDAHRRRHLEREPGEIGRTIEVEQQLGAIDHHDGRLA